MGADKKRKAGENEHQEHRTRKSRTPTRSKYDSRNRSRSPSPLMSYRHHSSMEDRLDEKEKHEIERRARMERLRAENEAEEKAAHTTQQDQKSNGNDNINDAHKMKEYSEEDLDGLDEDEQMKLLMGFSGTFGSTKNKVVEDNHSSAAVGAISKNKARKYRQYMNRKGGFNRPLDKMP